MDYYRSCEDNSQGMSLPLDGASAVPPGFRFHPTDEELVGYYLHKKVACKRIDLDVIKEIDLYKLEPWDLQEKCRIGSVEQNEWYFFSHKDKKYPTGTRTNRATAAGFWKATGRDKAILTKYKLIGQRKTLVFYKGRAPNGQKTDWIMHEYRLEDEAGLTANEDGWVVCRVFKKRNLVQQQAKDHHLQAAIYYGDSSGSPPTLGPYYDHSIGVCKHEIINAASYEQHAAYLFPNLPQLIDSSEICSDPPPFHQLERLDQELHIPLQQPMHEVFETSTPTTSSLFHHHHHHHAHHSSALVEEDVQTEWSVVDRLLAAAQQNQHFNHNTETTTSFFYKPGGDHAADDSLGSLAKLVRLMKGEEHKEHHENSLSSWANGVDQNIADRNQST